MGLLPTATKKALAHILKKIKKIAVLRLQ